MKATVSEPHSWKRVIEIEVPADMVQQAFNTRLSTYRKKMALPGFRQGKVPEQLVRTRFGKEIHAEAVDDLVQKCYADACKDKGISPVSQGSVKDIKADEGGPLTFTVETEVEPSIEIKGYQKLKIRASPNKIKPADVDKIVQELRERFATFNDVQRPVKKGDHVRFKYEKVEIDGTERTDISSPTYPVEIGSSTIKGFDKAVIGANAGDTVDADVVFPKDYPDKEIAGKKGMFRLAIEKVQEQVLAELNEEFLKKLGDYKTEDALRESIDKDLVKREESRAKSEAADKAIETLIKNNPFEVPPSMVERFIDSLLDEAKGRAEKSQAPAPTREEVAARYRDQAVHTIKRHRILDFIATAEGIKASQQDVDKQIREIADAYGQPYEVLKEALRRDGTVNRLRDDIRERKSLDYLIGDYDPSATVAEAAPEQQPEQPST